MNRPHGEHPTLGRCDCDECQKQDAERAKRLRLAEERRKAQHARDYRIRKAFRRQDGG